MSPEEAKLDELNQTIRQLERENADLRGEIEACHSMLDGARVGLPQDYNELTDSEKIRSMRLPGRLTQALLAWSNPVLANRV